MTDAHAIAVTACQEHHASQAVDEFALAVGVAVAVDPKIIVEIGCDAGGTLWAWRQICDRVYGITSPENGYAAGGSGRELVSHGAEVHIGDSHSRSAVEWLTAQLDGASIDVLVIDGDHTEHGVWQDISFYGPMVRDHGLIMMHDIGVTTDPRCEVYRVWADLSANPFHTEVLPGPHAWGVLHVAEWGPE